MVAAGLAGASVPLPRIPPPGWSSRGGMRRKAATAIRTTAARAPLNCGCANSREILLKMDSLCSSAGAEALESSRPYWSWRRSRRLSGRGGASSPSSEWKLRERRALSSSCWSEGSVFIVLCPSTVVNSRHFQLNRHFWSFPRASSSTSLRIRRFLETE